LSYSRQPSRRWPFAEASARFGEQGIVELGTIVGYYTAIGNALNAFQVPLPAGTPQPLPE